MPIKSHPIFDCLSCDAFMPEKARPHVGLCMRAPPAAQVTNVDKFGGPQVSSFFPPVQKGMFCLQHPMAKAFPPGEFVPKAAGEAEPINAGTPDAAPAPTVVEVDRVFEPPLPGEIKPEKAN